MSCGHCSAVYDDVQSFGSRDQLAGDTRVKHDVDKLTSVTVAGVEAKKTRQVKLCSVRHATLLASLPHKCQLPLPSARQHPSYGDCLEVKREYYQNCSLLGCVTQCSQSAAHLYEQFLQVQHIGFVTLGPLRHA